MKGLKYINQAFKLSAMALALTSSMSISAQEVESIKYTGEINSLVPQVNLSVSNTPTAFVEDVEITLDENGTHCRLTTSTQDFNYSYKAGGEPVCLFEWISDMQGLTQNGLKHKGVLTSSGALGLTYQVSVMNAGEKKTILQDTLQLDVNAPVAPVITGVSTKLGVEDVSGFEFDNYDRRQGLNGVTVSAEPRTFDQVVTIKGETCVIFEGDTSCEIGMGAYIPGIQDETLNGTEQITVAALDTKNYLTPVNQSINVNYDYRPPAIVDLVLNAQGNQGPITHNIDGVNFELATNEALLVLQTPHFDKAGDWWVPKVEQFEVIPDGLNSEEVGEVIVNGRLVRVPQLSSTYRDRYNMSISEAPTFIGDKVVYPLSLESLPDGNYNISAIVGDDYENQASADGIQKLIDRNAPALVGIFAGEVIRTSEPVYPVFLSDMYMYVTSGWSDGAQLTSITMDGLAYPYTEISKGLYQLSESESLVPGQRYHLEATAEDTMGNQITKSFDVLFSETQFDLYAKNDTVYAGVQDNDIRMNQRAGQRCHFTSSVELAVEISKGTLKGCTIDTSRVPVGLNVEVDNRGLMIDGVIDEVGLHEIGFDVVYHNYNGDTKVFPSEVVNVEALAADGIAIELLDRNKVAEGLYSIAHNSRYSTEFNVNYFNADVDIQISAGGNVDNTTLRQTRRTQPIERKVRVKRVDGGEQPVWSTVTYNVNANYQKDPLQNASASFDVIITPSSYTKAYLEVDESQQLLTDDSITLKGQIGKLDRETREIVYVPSEMGDWTAMLAVREGSSYTPISEEVSIDSQGFVQFTVSGQTLFDASRQFYMIANSKSEVEGFEMQIRSGSAFLEVLKAGAVEGGVRARTLESRIPFDTTMIFEFADNADEDVSGDYEWQISQDGTTWTNMPEMTNSRRLDVSVAEIGTNYYRVHMINRLTGIESNSEVVTVTGFDVADIQLSGPMTVYAGLPVTYEAQISDAFVGNTDGVYEWSLDDGQTWEYGTNTLEIIPSESFEIAVRYRLNSSDGIESEDVYSSSMMRVSVREPIPLSISLATPRVMEVGMEGTIEGRYREPFRDFNGNVVEVITLPDGTEVQAGSLVYIPASEDSVNGKTTFKYTVWVEGLEAQTKNTEVRELNLYDYQFNAPSLSVRNRYTIAPTTAYASVILDVENESPDIEYQYEWLLDKADGFEVTRDYGDRVNFNMNNAGSNVVAVRVSDNRGNEAEVTQIVELSEALPMDIDLQPRYTKSMLTAPIGVTMMANYIFDHPEDYPISLKWYVDGKLVSESTSDRHFYEFTEQGAKEIKVIIDSAFGLQGEQIMTLEIAPNIPPTCSPLVDDRGTDIVVMPNCTDEDGNIVQTFYSWEGQDELQGYSRINFKKADYPSLNVTIRTIDDGGEEAITSVSW